MKKSIIPLLALLFISISCSENNTDALNVDTIGSADYFISNQSNTDLKVVFTTSPQLSSKIDSIEVSSSGSKLILEDGIIGVNPKPSDSFSKITFTELQLMLLPPLLLIR